MRKEALKSSSTVRLSGFRFAYPHQLGDLHDLVIWELGYLLPYEYDHGSEYPVATSTPTSKSLKKKTPATAARQKNPFASSSHSSILILFNVPESMRVKPYLPTHSADYASPIARSSSNDAIERCYSIIATSDHVLRRLLP